jgi:plastocyanin
MKRTTLVLIAIVCGLAAAGIATGAATLKLSAPASGALKFDKKTLTAKAGTVTISMRNLSPLPHNVAVKGLKVAKKGKIVAKGGTSTVTVTLAKGSYTFYCSVPGHEAAGMKGKLTVS